MTRQHKLYAYQGLDSRRVSPENYLRLEREAEFRCEYFSREIVDREGAPLTHATILTHLWIPLANQLDRTRYDVMTAMIRVCNPERTFFA